MFHSATNAGGTDALMVHPSIMVKDTMFVGMEISFRSTEESHRRHEHRYRIGRNENRLSQTQ